VQNEVRIKFSDGSPYFLFVGLIIPRKNLATLLNAYNIYRKSGGPRIRLLIVGEKKWWDKAHEIAYQNNEFKEDILFIGRLQIEDLRLVMASAFALTFVPLFEGFGIPVLEAFACGTPVITSNTTSLPEVAGDAALLVNPLNAQDISMAMTHLAKSEKLREDLVNKGLARSKQFSWDITASSLWESISKCLNDQL